jgi:hypothetical protein
MTRENLFELTEKLYQSSMAMREINEQYSDMLLEMASSMLSLVEKGYVPEEIHDEVDAIKSEILLDD